MTVADVYIRDQWIRLDLNDDFYTQGPNTTSLLLEWPQKLSKEFGERTAVEEFFAKFVTVQKAP